MPVQGERKDVAGPSWTVELRFPSIAGEMWEPALHRYSQYCIVVRECLLTEQ